MAEYSDPDLFLVGVRTPLVMDYADAARRRGLALAGLRVGNATPRALQGAMAVIEIDEVPSAARGIPFIAGAFMPDRRRELVEFAVERGLAPAAALTDPTAAVSAWARLGAGTFIGAGAVVASGVLVANHVFVNRASSLGHHTVVESFVSIGPGVTVPSSVNIGAGAIVGAGAVILPGIRIGAGAVIAAGTRVRKDVPADVLAFGEPVRTRPRKGLRILDEYRGQE